VTALMCGDGIGLVEDGDIGVGESLGDLAGGGEAEEPGTDDGHS
jgi:hypothetical protein